MSVVDADADDGPAHRDDGGPAHRDPERLRAAYERHDTVVEVAAVEPQLASGGTGDPEDVTPHTLRHSVAYRIIQTEGGRLEDVQLRLRHANRSTTDQIYSHLVPR